MDDGRNYTPWETLEDAHTALVQCRLHTAGGLELRHLTATSTAGWFVSLTPAAVERLRLLLGIAPMHDTSQPLRPAGTRNLDEMALILLACGYTVLAPGQARDMTPCETPTPLEDVQPRQIRGRIKPPGDTSPIVSAPGESIIDAAARHFQARAGHAWTPAVRADCERELTARGWVHRLGYDEHRVELARDQELAQWFPPLSEDVTHGAR